MLDAYGRAIKWLAVAQSSSVLTFDGLVSSELVDLIAYIFDKGGEEVASDVLHYSGGVE